MRRKTQHIAMDQFATVNNTLQIGNTPVTRIAEQVGQTPFYAYDRALIKTRIKELREILPNDVHLHYAIKANPMPAIIQLMSGLVDGFDLASAGEMKIALDTEMPRHHISFAGPGKTDKELVQAIAAGIIINAESENEISRISLIAKKLDLIPKVALRINPDFEIKSSGMTMGGGAKQFGIDSERVPEILKRLSKLQLEFYGFHIFCGSQNLKAENIIEAHDKTFDLAFELSKLAPTAPKLLNIGGGLGIPYFPGEQRIDLQLIANNLRQRMPEIKGKLPSTEIVMELGRYLVGEAGIYVCKVIDKKISRGETYLVTDGGLHHHLAASGNFGQVIRKNYPVSIGNKMIGEFETVNIVGPLCTPLDILASKMDLPKAEIGDLIVVFQSGAYGYSSSPHEFLNHPAAVEVLL